MNLTELRTAMRTQIFDPHGSFLTDAECNAFLNMAQQHVANMVVAQNENYLLVSETFTVLNGSSQLYVFLEPSDRVRRIVEAHRVEQDLGDSDDDPTLEIIEFSAAKQKHGAYGAAGLKAKPPVFLFNQTIGLVQPANEIHVRIYYVKGLTDMVGTAECELPPEYQPLVPVFAAVMALAGENSDGSQLQAIFAQMVQSAGLGMQDRTETSE